MNLVMVNPDVVRGRLPGEVHLLIVQMARDTSWGHYAYDTVCVTLRCFDSWSWFPYHRFKCGEHVFRCHREPNQRPACVEE